MIKADQSAGTLDEITTFSFVSRLVALLLTYYRHLRLRILIRHPEPYSIPTLSLRPGCTIGYLPVPDGTIGYLPIPLVTYRYRCSSCILWYVRGSATQLPHYSYGVLPYGLYSFFWPGFWQGIVLVGGPHQEISWSTFLHPHSNEKYFIVRPSATTFSSPSVQSDLIEASWLPS